MPLRYCAIMFLAALTVCGQAGRGGRGGAIAANGAPVAQQPPPATDCAASGTVVNSVTGQAIPRAMVTLGGNDSSGSSTDATGHWSMTNIACGTRLPMASHPGFISPYQIPATTGRQSIQLVSGSPVTGIKVLLAPEASIAGTVHDADGDPLDSAQIRIMRVGINQGVRTLGNTGGTSVDSQGNFRIARLPPGRYIVCAASSQLTYPVGGGEPLVFRESCFPGPVSTGISSAMPVEPGREVRTSFTLTAARGTHVRGTVSGGPPVSDQPPFTQVQIMPGQNGMGGGRSARLMPDGTFDIASVPPGSYLVRANFRSPTPGPGPGLVADAVVDVGGSDVNNVALVVRQPGALSGNVRFELTATASSANANTPPPPPPPVNVNLNPPANGFPFSGPMPQIKWDVSHQSFEYNLVPAGQFRLNANINGSTGAYIKSVTLRGQDILNQPFNIEGTTGPVEVVVSDDAGGIDATVNGSDGNPIIGSVMLLSTTGRRVMLNAGDDGHATRKNVPSGEYKAWAFDNINLVPYADDQWMTQNAGPGERVTIASTGNATVTLKRIVAPPE